MGADEHNNEGLVAPEGVNQRGTDREAAGRDPGDPDDETSPGAAAGDDEPLLASAPAAASSDI